MAHNTTSICIDLSAARRLTASVVAAAIRVPTEFNKSSMAFLLTVSQLILSHSL